MDFFNLFVIVFSFNTKNSYAPWSQPSLLASTFMVLADKGILPWLKLAILKLLLLILNIPFVY